MNDIHSHELCTIERSPGRILLRVRHEPALLPGALTRTPHGARTLRGFAAHVASRLNEARAAKKSGQIYLSVHESASAPPRGGK